MTFSETRKHDSNVRGLPGLDSPTRASQSSSTIDPTHIGHALTISTYIPIHADADQDGKYGNGARSNGNTGDEREEPLPRWLRVHLAICTVTAWIMLIGGPVEMAFAAMLNDDLSDRGSRGASKCNLWYFNDKITPAQCHHMKTWIAFTIIGGTLCVVRLLTHALPVGEPTYKTIQTRVDPATTYTVRTAFSTAALLFHVVSVVLLGTSRLVRGEGEESHGMTFVVALIVTCCAIAVLVQQVYATGMAARRLRGRDREQVLWHPLT